MGTYDFGGALIDPDPLMRVLRGKELPFSAHPRVDPLSGDLYNFGMVMGLKPELNLYRVPQNGLMERSSTVKLDALGFLHDFAFTPNWRVFLFGPLTFDVPSMLLGLKPAMACASFAPKRATQVILVPRDGSQPVWLRTNPCFVFHFCNAFEDGADCIIADGLRYERFPEVAPFADLRRSGFGDFPKMTATRFLLDLKSGTVKEEQLSDVPGELPRIHPKYVGQPYRFFWCSATSTDWKGPYLSGVSKVDTETRNTVFRDFAPDLTSEPMFVPRPDSVHEDDGWLLVTVYRSDEHRSDLLVLDATDLSTVCRARLPHHESPGFHGTWVPADV
jgi:all-trans-8'-apo-beta-carotenal 15,15'-oxygenase